MLADRKPLATPAFLGIGVGAAVLGLLPWIVTGMRLPLQNLWEASTLPDGMPIALLPFSQYYLSFIVALIVIGSAAAGIAGRALPARSPRGALWSLIGGVALVQVIAVTQSAITTGSGLSDRSESGLYIAALVGGIVTTILIGIGMLALIARAPKAGALIALSIAAIASSSWLGGLVFSPGSVTKSSPVTDVLRDAIHLIPAVLIGVAIAWGGVNTVGRVIAGVASLLLLWIGPTLITAVSSAAGTRVLLKYPAEMLDYGIGVFRMAIAMPELWASNIALAVAVAVVGLVGLRTARTVAAR